MTKRCFFFHPFFLADRHKNFRVCLEVSYNRHTVWELLLSFIVVHLFDFLKASAHINAHCKPGRSVRVLLFTCLTVTGDATIPNMWPLVVVQLKERDPQVQTICNVSLIIWLAHRTATITSRVFLSNKIVSIFKDVKGNGLQYDLQNLNSWN